VTFLPYAPFRAIRHVKIGSETLDIRKGADRFSPLVECLGFHMYRLAGSPTPWCVRTGLSQNGTVLRLAPAMDVNTWPHACLFFSINKIVVPMGLF
jgi:hypothetical protein